MAFSIRKMLSNINYFKKPGEVSPEGPDSVHQRRPTYVQTHETVDSLPFERPEPDSTSKQYATSLKLPDSVRMYAAKKASLSDTDVQTTNTEGQTKKDRRKSKKLKLDVKKANRSTKDPASDSSNDVENTPKHILLDCNSADLFCQKFDGFDLNKSFDIFDAMSDDSSYEKPFDVDSLSDHTDTDVSIVSDHEKEPIKMCRKVDPLEDCNEDQLVRSATPESFGDVEIDKSEENRISLLLNYHMKLEKLECFLKKLLSEFQFHIEVSKVFNCRSIVTTLPGTDVSKIPKILGEVTYIDNLSCGPSPTGSWNIVMEKEDNLTKFKIKEQLLSMRYNIDEFIKVHLQNRSENNTKKLTHNRRSITFDIHKGKRQPQKRLRINIKKKYKRYDYPDLRDAMLNLFSLEDRDDVSMSGNLLSDLDESDSPKCSCQCRYHRSPSTQTDSGVTTKNDRSLSSQSISSSIGNFSLDSSTLTAYSESLDQIISYNSYQDSSLCSTLLQKAAIERITFYVQVHSIQLKCESVDQECDKNVISFYCPACKIVENDENGLLKHILSYKHGEKIHFLYKTAYIKKCVSAGKEIQPSTVLNPMTMYRDENRIVCFGDAMFACSLCFENLIIGESVLMAHCAEIQHLERRERLSELVN